MRKNMRLTCLLFLGVSLACGVLAGCSSAPTTTPVVSHRPDVPVDGPRLTFVNATGLSNPVIAKVDNTIQAAKLANGEMSEMHQYSAGGLNITIENPDGTPLLLKSNFDFETKTDYLLVLYNSGAGNEKEPPLDLKIIPASDESAQRESKVRIDRATNVFGDVDVHIVPDNGSQDDNEVIQLSSNDPQGEISAFDPGRYDLQVFPTGGNDKRINEKDEVTLEQGRNYIFVLASDSKSGKPKPVFIRYTEK